jgi:AcrR family transcriptional regulator
MAGTNPIRSERRAREHGAARASILQAARRVAARDGARDLSLRGVAAEAGYAPAALYGYFTGKDDLLLALAAEDLASISRAMREAVKAGNGTGKLAAASSAALTLLCDNETMAAAQGALPATAGGGLRTAAKANATSCSSQPRLRDWRCSRVPEDCRRWALRRKKSWGVSTNISGTDLRLLYAPLMRR